MKQLIFSYEDHHENKKQLTPRRRRVAYPPITPNACFKDSVASAAFDCMWQEVSCVNIDLFSHLKTHTCLVLYDIYVFVQCFTLYYNNFSLI